MRLIAVNSGMWRTVGHERAVSVIRGAIDQDRLAHAYIIDGPENIGKMTLAIDLAKAVSCLGVEAPCGTCTQCIRIQGSKQTDVRVIGDEVKEHNLISIDQVREIQRESNLTPFEGSHRIIIFNRADSLSQEASNALLKFLEEPPDYVILVLLTLNKSRLPDTLISRCQLLELRPVSNQIIVDEISSRFHLDSESANEIANISGGRIGWAFRAAEDEGMLAKFYERLDAIQDIVGHGTERRFAYVSSLTSSVGREAIFEELSLWKTWFRNIILVKEGMRKFITYPSRTKMLETLSRSLTGVQVALAIRAIRKAEQNLDHNANSRLALEMLMLELPILADGSAGNIPKNHND